MLGKYGIVGGMGAGVEGCWGMVGGIFWLFIDVYGWLEGVLTILDLALGHVYLLLFCDSLLLLFEKLAGSVLNGNIVESFLLPLHQDFL
jgi:hypothetical protein